jgi:predicted nuclease of predicted toxin-antitoxin system
VSLLFDQNLSRRLPALLANEFPGFEQVLLVGLDRADDGTVWAYAAAHGLAVVSQDVDFRNMCAAHGPPPKVIWLRVGNGPTRDVEALLRSRAADIRTFLSDPAASVLELP